MGEREEVEVKQYSVIYQAIEDVEAAMKGMLDPVFEEKVIGEAEATILNDALTQVMILMPQSLAGVEVKVTYSAEKGGLEVHSASEPVTVKLTGNWEAGSKTAYVLSLNGDAINLTGSSDDTSWSEKTDVNTDVNK